MMEQLPRVPTAVLKTAGYGRQKGEQVDHKIVGDFVTFTFLSPTFFGGISRHTVPLEQFERDFAIIGEKRVKR